VTLSPSDLSGLKAGSSVLRLDTGGELRTFVSLRRGGRNVVSIRLGGQSERIEDYTRFTYIGEIATDGFIYGAWSENPVPGMMVEVRGRMFGNAKQTLSSESVVWPRVGSFRPVQTVRGEDQGAVAPLLPTEQAEKAVVGDLEALAVALGKSVVFNAYNASDPLALRLEFETEEDRLAAANAIDQATGGAVTSTENSEGTSLQASEPKDAAVVGLIERLEAKFSGDVHSASDGLLVNPDGPEAASVIRRLQAERDALIDTGPVEGDVWWKTVIGAGEAHKPSGELPSIKHLHPLTVKPIYEAHNGTAVADVIAGLIFNLSISHNREQYLVADANERAERAEAERDEAIKHLTAMSHVAPRTSEVNEALAFLEARAALSSLKGEPS